MNPLHNAAQQGYTLAAGTYAKGRPEYPAELLPWLGSALGLAHRKTVVDVGAGTGKFTRLLLQTGSQVLALEPVEAMRAELQRGLPAVAALAGTAQAMPLPAASADALVCAQAFHWFASAESLAEMHRVLRPGGRLGLVWNVRDESVDWVAEITRIITPFEGDAPRYYKGDWRHAFAAAPFSALQLTALPHQHVGTLQEVILDRFLSVSFIAALPADQKAGVARQLQDLIDTHPALRGRAELAFPYRTEAFCCQAL